MPERLWEFAPSAESGYLDSLSRRCPNYRDPEDCLSIGGKRSRFGVSLLCAVRMAAFLILEVWHCANVEFHISARCRHGLATKAVAQPLRVPMAGLQSGPAVFNY